MSPIPGNTTLAPKSEKKPSAAIPQRARACDRSWRHAIATSPWLPPSAMSVGRSCIGAMLASSSRISSTGGWDSGRCSPDGGRRAAKRYAAVRRSRMSPTMSGPTCVWVSPVAQM